MKVRAVKSVDYIKEGNVYEIDWTVQEDVTLKEFKVLKVACEFMGIWGLL